MSSRLAVIILTRNEEKNIGAAIDSASFADEILVVDSGSTDATQAIAESRGAKFVFHPMGEEGFAGQRNFALGQTEAEWVFYLDADERITERAADCMAKIVARNEKAAFSLKRMNIIMGKLMKHGAHRPDWCLRLFRRGTVSWEGVVHERPVSALPSREMDGELLHHTYSDWTNYFHKLSSYTDMMAERMHEEGKTAGLADLTVRPIFAFFRAYVLQKGFLDGELGLVFSMLHSYYTFMKYLKLRYRTFSGGQEA